MKKTKFDIEKNIIELDASHRGGVIKVDVSTLFPYIEDPVMGAYQNYLGGGMRGSISGGAMFEPDDLKEKDKKIFYELKEDIKKYFHKVTSSEEMGMNDEWNTSDYDEQQKLPNSYY